jgi:hypothetical protein
MRPQPAISETEVAIVGALSRQIMQRKFGIALMEKQVRPLPMHPDEDEMKERDEREQEILEARGILGKLEAVRTELESIFSTP